MKCSPGGSVLPGLFSLEDWMASKNYLGDDSQIVEIKTTRKRALQLGLVHCKHCGLPPNNHFDFKPYKCAHDSKCPGYEEVISA